MININLLYILFTVTLASLFLARQIRYIVQKNYTRWVDVLFLVGSLCVAMLFQNSNTLFALILFWGLFTISIFDIFYRVLPNIINFSLLALGLVLAIKNQFISVTDSTLGVVMSYGVLGCISFVYSRIYGRVGIGRGDFKLTSALGAWLGIKEIPGLLFFSSVLGCLFYCIMFYDGRYEHEYKIPLGVFLSIVGMGIFTLRFSSWHLLLG